MSHALDSLGIHVRCSDPLGIFWRVGGIEHKLSLPYRQTEYLSSQSRNQDIESVTRRGDDLLSHDIPFLPVRAGSPANCLTLRRRRRWRQSPRRELCALLVLFDCRGEGESNASDVVRSTLLDLTRPKDREQSRCASSHRSSPIRRATCKIVSFSHFRANHSLGCLTYILYEHNLSLQHLEQFCSLTVVVTHFKLAILEVSFCKASFPRSFLFWRALSGG
jgi:hypothetical protein